MKKIMFAALVLFFGVVIKGFSQTVYASDKGGKYHTADCKLSGDANALTLKEAKKTGKTSCGVCKPDEHLKDKLVQCSGKTATGDRCKRMTASKNNKCYQHQSK